MLKEDYFNLKIFKLINKSFSNIKIKKPYSLKFLNKVK